MAESGSYAVRALLPLSLRHLSEAELAARDAGIPEGPLVDLPGGGARRTEASDVLEDLGHRMTALERKVDTLIELLLRKEQQEARRTAAPVELSMDRVTFLWPEALDPDEAFELSLVLGLLPPVELHAVVSVDRCDLSPEGEGYEVTARFNRLGENAADALHRYMLTVQRRARRSRAVL